MPRGKPPLEIVERRFGDGLTDGTDPPGDPSPLKVGVYLACRQPIHSALEEQFALLLGDVELQLFARFHRRKRAEPEIVSVLAQSEFLFFLRYHL